MKSIHVTRAGRGFPLVLFHGWGFDSRIWHTVLPLLVNHYEVYCVDLPGFGLSPFMDWGAFNSSLMSQLPSKFALAGWSLGGMVATRLALEAPDQVTHLINIASSPCFIEDLRWPGVAKSVLSVFGDRLVSDPDKVLQEFMQLQLPGQGHQTFASATLQGLQMGLEWLLTWDFRDQLETLQLPVLYLFGRLDAIIPRKTMMVMQERYPRFEYLMINKAAHALFISHRDDFAMAVEHFL